MPNVNYIASAGTGKTYNLVEVLVEKLNEISDIKEILILTFTEKSALELKERIINRLKTQLAKDIPYREKRKIHSYILDIERGYIGTFHSVFLKFLKKYPEITHIDRKTAIISENIDRFIDSVYEEWVEKDYIENKEEWSYITSFISPEKLKNTLKTIYQNRFKIKKEKINLNSLKKEVTELSLAFEENLKIFIENKQIKEILTVLEKENVKKDLLKRDPEKMLKSIKDGNFVKISDKKRGKSYFFKSSKNSKSKEIFNSYIKPIIEDEIYQQMDRNLCELANRLETAFLNLNSRYILKKYFDFEDFINIKKKETNSIDFVDILEKTVELLKNKDIKNRIKSKFKYIFIDEFQDTDKLQLEIIKKISEENIYVFGDPKQCIYEWRNANIDDYFSFLKENKFRNVVLDTNFRSSETLVRFFNALFSKSEILKHIPEEYRKPVKNGAKSIKNRKVQIINLKIDEKKAVESEAFFTVYTVRNLLKEGEKLDDILILLRRNKDIIIFREVFEKYSIPVKTFSNENLFDKEEIKTVLNILKYINSPDNELFLLYLLKSPLFSATEKELMEERLEIENRDISFIKRLARKKEKDVEEILKEIFEKTNLLEIFSLFPDGNKKIKNLEKLYILGKKLSSEGYSLREFIDYIETGFEELPQTDEKGVEIMTMHKSKGLEKKIVIIPMLSSVPGRINIPEIYLYKDKPLLNFYYAKSKELSEIEKCKENTEIVDKIKESIKNENERILYVALTRAKERLILINSKMKKSYKHSLFSIIEKGLKNVPKDLIEFKEIDIKEINIEPDEKKEEKTLYDIEKKLKTIKEEEEKRKESYEQAIKKEIITSVSKEMEKADIDIKKIRKEENDIPVYTGILSHKILERINFGDFSFEEMKRILKEEEENIPEDIRENVAKQVLNIFKNFEKSPIYEELKSSEIMFKELPFSLYQDGKIIDGRIDMVYRKGNKVVVMDFKTNRYNNFEEMKKIAEKYKVQKEYYLKAVKNLFPKENVVFKFGFLWNGDILEF